jgi:hypothetical protein
MNIKGSYMESSSLTELRAAYILGTANKAAGKFYQVSRALPQDQQKAYSLAWSVMI